MRAEVAYTLFIAAWLCLLVPAGPDDPLTTADLIGVYDGERGNDVRGYRVTISQSGPREPVIAEWADPASGKSEYRGVLERVKLGDGEYAFKETYLAVPGLSQCEPWTWKVQERKPLWFADHGPGWTLTRIQD